MNDNTTSLENCQYLIKQKENEINSVEEENNNLKNEVLNLKTELNKLNNELKENEINKKESKEEDIKLKSESDLKMNNLIKENKSLKCKNLLLLEENTILKSFKNELEKQKKNVEAKPEKIQYLIETNNFNIFYNNSKNPKPNNNKVIPKFINLIINSTISLSLNKIQQNNKQIPEPDFKEHLLENEKYKNDYDHDEEINESELNLVDDENEYDNNINYDEMNEDINQEINNNENELYNNIEVEMDKNIKKKKKRKIRKKNKSQTTNDLNKINNNINIINEQNEQNENIKKYIEEKNINEINKNQEQISQSQKKKNKIKRKLDNMKSDYLALLDEKEILLKKNDEYKEKIKELEMILNNKESYLNNISYTPIKEIELDFLNSKGNEDIQKEVEKLNYIIIQLKSQLNEQENNLKIDTEDITLQLNEKLLEKDMIIEELTETISKLEKEYKLSLKQIESMKNQILDFEKGLGVDEKMNNLQALINQKEEQLIILTNQLNEYQSNCDDIIMGNSLEKKDEQIKLLFNEVKSIRSKIQDILSFEDRIDNYEEFLKIISELIKYTEKNQNEEIKLICQKLKSHFENYELNGIKFYNRIMQEIFGINYEELEEGKEEENYDEKNNVNDNSINNNE